MTSELHGPERELEEALLGLRPSSPGLDHDLMMFRAGQAAARRRLRLWQGSTGALLLGLAVSIFGGLHDARRSGPVPGTPLRAVMAAPRVPAAGSYAALRSRVLEQGVDVLPLPETGGLLLSVGDAADL